MGREIHVDMKTAIDKALAAAGVSARIAYGSYRTEPITPFNDGLFAFDNTYPDLLQMAMPSLYVAGNQRAVAQGVAANRARMKTNDIIPWLTTGCYGDYDPRHTRDMVLEALANGSRGVTYYWYGHFDAAHFKYHAEAVDIAAPVEDIFMDGQPLAGLECSHKQVKLCGMGLGGQLAVLVSNYDGLAPETQVTVRIPAAAGTPVWDLHSGRRIDQTGPDGFFAISLGHTAAHLYYVGQWDRLPDCRPSGQAGCLSRDGVRIAGQAIAKGTSDVLSDRGRVRGVVVGGWIGPGRGGAAALCVPGVWSARSAPAGWQAMRGPRRPTG